MAKKPSLAPSKAKRSAGSVEPSRSGRQPVPQAFLDLFVDVGELTEYVYRKYGQVVRSSRWSDMKKVPGCPPFFEVQGSRMIFFRDDAVAYFDQLYTEKALKAAGD